MPQMQMRTKNKERKEKKTKNTTQMVATDQANAMQIQSVSTTTIQQSPNDSCNRTEGKCRIILAFRFNFRSFHFAVGSASNWCFIEKSPHRQTIEDTKYQQSTDITGPCIYDGIKPEKSPAHGISIDTADVTENANSKAIGSVPSTSEQAKFDKNSFAVSVHGIFRIDMDWWSEGS